LRARRESQIAAVKLPIPRIEHRFVNTYTKVLIDPEQVGIEEEMDVGAQEQPIAQPVSHRTVIRLDVGRLERSDLDARRHCTLAAVRRDEAFPESTLTWACDASGGDDHTACSSQSQLLGLVEATKQHCPL